MRQLGWALIYSGVYIRRGNLDIQKDTRDVHTHRKDHVRTYCKVWLIVSQRETSGETKPANTF